MKKNDVKRGKRVLMLDRSSSESSDSQQVTVLDEDEVPDDVPIAVMARRKKNTAESSREAANAEPVTSGSIMARGSSRRRIGKATKQE